MQDAFNSYATFGEKMSKVALEAAEKSTEISSKWTKDTISKMGDIAIVKDEPTDYTKAMTDFASAQAEMTAETMAAFAEVAKKVQMETVELMLAAGKDTQEDATAAMKKATTEDRRRPPRSAPPSKRTEFRQTGRRPALDRGGPFRCPPFLFDGPVLGLLHCRERRGGASGRDSETVSDQALRQPAALQHRDQRLRHAGRYRRASSATGARCRSSI